MNRIHSLWAVAALVAGAAPAMAQGLEFGPGLVLEGNVELQQYHVAKGAEGAAIAPDLTLRWQSYGVMGAEVNVDSVYDLKTDAHATNLWGALTLGYDFGTIKIGAPRPIVETMKPMIGFGSNLSVNTELRGLTGSITSDLALNDGGFVPGVAFQSAEGELTWGVSVHDLDVPNGVNHDNFTTLEAVAVRELGSTKFYGALQLAQANDSTDSVAELGAVWTGSPMSMGLKVGRHSVLTDATYGQIQLGYEVMPALRVSADVMHLDIENATNQTVYGASAQYDIGANAYVKAGATTTDNSAYEVYDLSLGWNF